MFVTVFAVCMHLIFPLAHMVSHFVSLYFYTFKVFSTSMGLTKTVYNPVALKAAQKTTEDALKKKQVREMQRERG